MYTISKNPPDTPEWLHDRLGKMTSSVFNKIVTTKGALSASHEGLVNRAVAEIIMNEPDETFCVDAMERGTCLEDEALRFFNFTYDYSFEKCGFVDSGKGYGCSPDGMNEKRRVGLELKCPLAHTHLSYLADGGLPKKYIHQVQGSMMVTGFDKWVFGSYHPHFPSLHVVVDRDEEFISKLQKHVIYCADQVQEKLKKLKPKLEAA